MGEDPPRLLPSIGTNKVLSSGLKSDAVGVGAGSPHIRQAYQVQ